MATAQKAWRLHSYGGPETMKLDDIPIPTPGKSQDRVAVNAVGINSFDWKIREGYVKDDMPLPLPFTLGVEFSGTVEALGEGSSHFKVGDRVMMIATSLGAFAESITIDESILARIPDTLNDVEAASLPMPALTAWQSLYGPGEVYPGKRILIQGVSGIVGAFAVQFAKVAGAYVIGTASAKNREYVMSLGADEFIDHQKEKFEEHVKDIDLVLDYVLVGGAENTTNRSWSVLKQGGAIMSVADPSIMRNIPDEFKGYFRQTSSNPAKLDAIAQQLAGGKTSSKVAKVFSRGELVEAMEINNAGGTTGRLIVDFKRA